MITVIAAEIHNVNIPNCIPNPNNNLFPGSPANNIEIDRKTKFTTIEPVSEFPSSTRDFSFSINNLSNVNIVISMLDGVSDKLIKNSFIFDFYQNDELNTVKLGYRFIFQSNQKTLSDEDINKKVSEILEPILQLEGVSIPGM